MSVYKVSLFLIIGITLALAIVLAGFRLNVRLRERQEPTAVAPAGGRFLRIGASEIFVQERGSRTPIRPTILLIHGAGSWSEIWKPTMERLAEQGFHSIAIDMLPFGLSTADQTHNYDTLGQAAIILGVLDQMKIDRVVLVGHSHGGPAALAAGAQIPHKLKALVLESVMIGLPEEEGGEPPELSGFLQWAFSRDMVRETLAAMATYPGFSSWLLQSYTYDDDKVIPSVVAIFQKPLYVKYRTPQISEWFRSLLEDADDSFIKGTFYKDFKMPSLVIWGKEDEITPAWHAAKIAKTLPNCTLKLIEEVGHIPHLESPESFKSALTSFLNINFPVP